MTYPALFLSQKNMRKKLSGADGLAPESFCQIRMRPFVYLFSSGEKPVRQRRKFHSSVA
jgi:hypothetical protein